jgi:hypothetical protein
MWSIEKAIYLWSTPYVALIYPTFPSNMLRPLDELSLFQVKVLRKKARVTIGLLQSLSRIAADSASQKPNITCSREEKV